MSFAGTPASGRGAGFSLLVLLAYVLFLQGLTTAYARTLMATDQFGPVFVICAPSGKIDAQPEEPLKSLTQECCNSLCKAAAAIGPSIQPSSVEVSWTYPRESSADLPFFRTQASPPQQSGSLPDARAPPAFSV